ncbi:hypothetical protein [Lacrimispora sp. 38-1]|uniref:hypothetical protein n=1 Tax=Lacrimispora sp. 38-1 TaxID=3125778 RepID=UPI003CF0883F
MDNTKKIYFAKEDPQFQEPYIDTEEIRERNLPGDNVIPYLYIHGGFHGTNVKFIFCFPQKEQYQGRFFQFLSPFPGPDEEIASLEKVAEDDKIAFAITHGAYFVETNMGSGAAFETIPDSTIVYRASAAAAEYSRVKAKELYGEHRVYGYIYGGSGGGYKTISCIENTKAWDGGVPYIIGSPVAIPNCHTTKVHGLRVLRHVLPRIVDALEPGGSGDMYEGLNKEEAAVLKEVTAMGMPPRSWFWHKNMDDGALPVLAPSVVMNDPGYFVDFWKEKGYMGTEENGSAVNDRIQFRSRVKRVYIPEEKKESTVSAGNGADDAFKKMLNDGGKCYLELDKIPTGKDLYLCGVNIIFEDGEAKDQRLLLGSIVDNKVTIGMCFGVESIPEVLGKVKAGDQVMLDNSDYIAIQTYHRHQVPDREYTVWDQYRDKSGNPVLPQRQNILSQSIALSGAGSIQDGDIQGKAIVVASVMDESAFPWQPDWYRRKVTEEKRENVDDQFRLWYVDNSLHDDQEKTVDELHVTSYMGLLRQALLDLSDWVEKGIEPSDNTAYTVEDGQVILPLTARERRGIQQVVTLTANSGVCARVKTGEEVYFEAKVQFPPKSGKVTAVEWSFEGEQDFPVKSIFEEKEDYTVAEQKHIYQKPGTYFAVVRVKANRHGDSSDIFTQVKNICRARVIVE